MFSHYDILRLKKQIFFFIIPFAFHTRYIKVFPQKFDIIKLTAKVINTLRRAHALRSHLQLANVQILGRTPPCNYIATPELIMDPYITSYLHLH